MNGTFYLNNSGSRWVNFTNGVRDNVSLNTKSGKLITRRVSFWESFVNFAVVHISYKGKRLEFLLMNY